MVAHLLPICWEEEEEWHCGLACDLAHIGWSACKWVIWVYQGDSRMEWNRSPHHRKCLNTAWISRSWMCSIFEREHWPPTTTNVLMHQWTLSAFPAGSLIEVWCISRIRLNGGTQKLSAFHSHLNVKVCVDFGKLSRLLDSILQVPVLTIEIQNRGHWIFLGTRKYVKYRN